MRNKFFKKFITIIFLLIYNIEIFAANLVVDPNSAHNTKLDVAPNGVPVVNISTPNDKGISINEFSEYNIDEKGQVLNNADNYGRSHLAGIISANPNLAPNQAANLIILQVNGSNRSQIEGYLEALSRQKVDVILSNENGLYINNGGTINIKNFTATTGRVNLKDGDFVGIDVEKGNIVIGPKGMDGTNANYVELIAKTLELRGNVVTNDLKVVAGSNKIDKKGNITGKNNTSNNIAIDGRELGGMYAGVIKIISTDKGAGVNSDAFIVSKNSKLEITADGKIKVNKVQGKGIDIKGKEYEQKDLAYSDEGISINADRIKLSGTGTQANKQINLNGAVENSATIYTKEGLKTKDLTNTGTVQAINKIEVEGNLTNRGEILTNGNLTAKDTTSTKKLIAKEGVSVDKLENSGIVATDKKLDIKGNLINSGEVQAIDNIAVLENVNNSGEVLTNSSFSAKDVISTKKLIAKNGITTNKLENKGIVATAKNLNVSGDLNNKGKIQAANRIDVKNNVDNSGEIQTLDNINIKGNVVNTGDILTNGSLTSKDVKNEKIRLILKEKDKEKKGENGSIGTPATRASIIEGLFKRRYLERKGKTITSTELAREYLTTLPENLKSADMTALWWSIQEEIKEGKSEKEKLTDFVLHQTIKIMEEKYKKIENPEGENGNKSESENIEQKSSFSETEHLENSGTSVKSRKPEELTIDFQISKEPKQKDENFKVKDSKKIIEKGEIDSKNEEQEIEKQTEEAIEISEVEDSESSGKRVRYEDGTWKFF